MACLRASLFPAERLIFKYSLGLTEDSQKKPYLVVAGLRVLWHWYCGPIQGESSLLLCWKHESAAMVHDASTRILLASSRATQQ